MKDLFNTPEQLPFEVQAVLKSYSKEDNTYESCGAMLKELESLGYTFDYDLHAEPSNLRALESISEYEKQALDFLKSTNTKFQAEFKEFGSMPFDKDKQKRNIYEITLSNYKGSYTFDFGTSIADSCALEPKMGLLAETDILHVYAGLKSVNNQALQAGIIMNITKQDLLTKPDTLISDFVDQLETQMNIVQGAKNKKAYELYESGKISRDDRDSRLINKIEKGIAYQCVNNAIQRKIKELNEEMVYSKDLQGNKITTPSAYDVLACITKYNPETFENFCSEFGYDTDSKSAEKTYKAVTDEWQNVAMLFNDDELEELREIQ